MDLWPKLARDIMELASLVKARCTVSSATTLLIPSFQLIARCSMLTVENIGSGENRIGEGMEIADLKKRYLELFGFEPTGLSNLQTIQESLGLSLPIDFREIAAFYRGGMVGGISHYSIEPSGPPPNVAEETLRLRTAIGLPHSMVVLAEPTESLIVMDTAADCGSPEVIWLDAIDAHKLRDREELRKPDVWTSYADFFGYLLDRENDERSDL